MTKGIFIRDIDPEYFEGLLLKLDKYENSINELKTKFEPKSVNDYVSAAAAGTRLDCDRLTISNWSDKGLFPKYHIGARTYYKWSEIEAAMQKTKV